MSLSDEARQKVTREAKEVMEEYRNLMTQASERKKALVVLGFSVSDFNETIGTKQGTSVYVWKNARASQVFKDKVEL